MDTTPQRLADNGTAANNTTTANNGTRDGAARPRILVIKLGALGDVVQATGPFAAIRAHHPDAHITLLTTPPWAGLLALSGWFDAIDTGGRPRKYSPREWRRLLGFLARNRFDRVYDLQTADRSTLCFWLMALLHPLHVPQWNGIARLGSHRHTNPARDAMHTIERQAEQLAVAGIGAVPPPSLDFVREGMAKGPEDFGLARPYALLAAGGAPHRPDKRWPLGHWTRLARALAERGVQPVLTGTKAEAQANATIAAFCPAARDLTGDTSLADLVRLARGAAIAIGNDTGPMHLAAVAGAPCVVLYSSASDPALCAQRGPRVTILRRERLDELGVEEVMGVVEGILTGSLAHRD
ncbi:MAG: glycosyltransferase family 9 protein [SAR202 cluster bacterium]|nr:glycosyltransferase family 9 protein [SAR202 cluster bacterium]